MQPESPASDLAAEIRSRRTSAGLSHAQLATRIGYTRQYASLAERPGKGLPSAGLIKAIDDALSAGGALLTLHARAAAARRARRPASRSKSGPQPSLTDDTSEDVIDLLGPGETVAVLDALTRSIIDRYEVEGPRLLTREAESARRTCHHLARKEPSTRAHLVGTGARIAGLLAYMSVNLDRRERARTYAIEATMLATAARDTDLLAWIKGTESLAAYYRGHYDDALGLARAGVRIAAGSPQRIRLLVNGVARAAGKRGDSTGVARAVGEALDIAGDGVPALTPCLDFAPYGQARTIANAATAHLSAGDYTQALELTAQLDSTIDQSDSDWSRALVQLDTATALALSGNADLADVVHIGINALTVSQGNPIASIDRRANELAACLREVVPQGNHDDFTDALNQWRQGR